jgi:hypothetical protein
VREREGCQQHTLQDGSLSAQFLHMSSPPLLFNRLLGCFSCQALSSFSLWHLHFVIFFCVLNGF